MNTRSMIVTAAAVVTLAITVAAANRASDAAPGIASHLNTTAGLTATGQPLAIRGYDPVSYFTAGEPQAGRASLSATHDGATYRFASEQNQKAFESNPTRYLPQFGGYCAYGVSVGKKFDGDPNVWSMLDGKLFLNLNPEIAGLWREDVAGLAVKAERQWTSIRNRAPATL